MARRSSMETTLRVRLSRRQVLVGGAGLTFAGLAPGCIAIGIPLPPPSKPDISPPDGAGIVTLRGVVTPEATVFAQNLRNDRGVLQHTGDTGRYEMLIEAEVNDQIVMWYRLDGEDSQSAIYVVPAEGSDGEQDLPGLPPGFGPGGASGN